MLKHKVHPVTDLFAVPEDQGASNQGDSNQGASNQGASNQGASNQDVTGQEEQTIDLMGDNQADAQVDILGDEPEPNIEKPQTQESLVDQSKSSSSPSNDFSVSSSNETSTSENEASRTMPSPEIDFTDSDEDGVPDELEEIIPPGDDGLDTDGMLDDDDDDERSGFLTKEEEEDDDEDHDESGMLDGIKSSVHKGIEGKDGKVNLTINIDLEPLIDALMGKIKKKAAATKKEK